jgi:hypothetical protein
LREPEDIIQEDDEMGDYTNSDDLDNFRDKFDYGDFADDDFHGQPYD